MTGVLRLTEHRPQRGVPLTTAQAALLTLSKLVTVAPEPGGGWCVTADREMVGSTRLSSAQTSINLVITPKLPVRRLFFLLGHAQKGVDWHRHATNVQEHQELVPAIAHAFARMCERALNQGVLQGYSTVEESAMVLRGRLRTADQIRHRFGRPLPAEIRYDDHTVDIPENRLLLTAARKLLREQDLAPATRALLRRILLRLDGVSSLDSSQILPLWRPSRLNTRLQSSLRLAEIVLRSGSYEFEENPGLHADGLVLRMWQVFEDFVTRALTDALRPMGGRCLTQDRRFHLDHAKSAQLRPDFVYEPPGAHSPGGVVDVKYKQVRGTRGNTGDLYQMLAYCTRLNLPEGHLVYAAGPGTATTRHHLHGGPGVTIHQHALHLDTEPGSLLAQIDTIAAAVRNTSPKTKSA
ncbi:McrC family protein [Nocardiopsis sp. L17-MgMaSL7]|uniref:McrC family protein n=1 Tax=Nocardiopsis sp. L17-MgMaSL7 TaxID=1938893 RepID=UPI000D71D7A4|nr:restriction endonuclease [Nocardiopsis sp. L17-MgMaSL7]PWV54850.1 5-methylcytosine-specific restriction enzyme subunit McrC [Nocardiopsis sp. L17-MgMaSL7]